MATQRRTSPLHKTPGAPSRGPRRPIPRPSESASLERAIRRVPRGATLRLQWVDCGKCRKWHGPYWYAFWFVDGKTRSEYVGSDRKLAAFVARRGGDSDAAWDTITEDDPRPPRRRARKRP
jgi:hypothetical protein